MSATSMLLLMRKKARIAYAAKIKALFGSALVAYFPLDETSGVVAADTSGNGRNMAYIGTPSLANVTSLQGKPSVFVGPTAGAISVNGAFDAGRLNGAEGTISGFAKYTAGQWALGEAADRALFGLYIDASNQIQLFLRAGASYANRLSVTYRAGGVDPSGGSLATILYSGNGLLPPYTWYNWALTWSKSNDRVRVYIHGVLISEATGLGTWAGTSFFSGFTNIGTFRTNWFGVGNQNMSDVFALNREATQVEMVTAATVSIRPLKLAHIGDSITIAASPNTGWAFQYPPSYNSGYWIYTNSAVGGQSIAANMATQVATIANADRIIMALGTNDNNAGDMAALQATVETGIDNLRTANPLATIYYLNVLPAWTNNTSGPEVAKGNIRTAIAAACAAKGVTCWDPYTTPWILQSDTQDGLHPTLAGHAKIAAQVLARLA